MVKIRTPPSVDLVVRECLAAWNEKDGAVRRERLGVAWSDAGIFIDPLVRVEGRDAMSQYIARCQERDPGCRFVVTSGIARHHDQFHFTWARHDAAGNEVIAGCDTGELDAARTDPAACRVLQAATARMAEFPDPASVVK